jgi:hypothetical protein
MKPSLSYIDVLLLVAFTAAPIATADEADPETVYIIFSVKRGREKEFQEVNKEAWTAYQRLSLAFKEPHVSVKGTDQNGLPYFVDIMTWKNHSIPDNIPAEIEPIWAKMRQLCEKRAGRDGIDFTEVELMTLFTGLSLAGDKKQKIDSKEFERLMQTIADSWNEGDARKAADCFAENAIYSEPPDKQLYKGRTELFKFFGGNEGRKSAMKMTWHHLVFDEREQVGAGEFTFEFGSKVHGVAMIKVAEGKIGHWREYWYESALDWEKFIGENKF